MALTLLVAMWTRIRRNEAFNNLDLFDDTPLSIMLTRDEWAWSERNAFPNNREGPNVLFLFKAIEELKITLICIHFLK
jgi:hypothetical protein